MRVPSANGGDADRRNGYSLVASSLVTSGLGFVFWVVAARGRSTVEVGIESSLIAAMIFLANVASLNLGNALNRFVPTAGSEVAALVRRCYGLALACSVVVAAIFVAAVGSWRPSLSALLSGQWPALGFVAATGVWVLFVLQDFVLAGLRLGPVVLAENVLYGVAKIVLLAALAPFSGSIITAWTIPAVVAVGVVSLRVFQVHLPRHAAAPPRQLEALPTRSLATFVAGDYLATILWQATVGLLPLFVLVLLGAQASAYTFLAWNVTYTLYLVTVAMGMSLVTAGAADPGRLPQLERRIRRQSWSFVVPAACVITLVSPWILLVFGQSYSSGAATLLRLFALSAIPNVVTTTFMCTARVQRRVGAMVVVSAAQTAVTVVAIAALSTLGPNGVGAGWLFAQGAVAAGVGWSERRRVRRPARPEPSAPSPEPVDAPGAVTASTRPSIDSVR